MTSSRPRGNIIPRSEVTTEKKKSYKDFPDVCIVKDETLDILKTGKKVNSGTLAEYLNIGYDAAETRLKKLEKMGLCTSEKVMIKDKRGRNNHSTIYYIKVK